VTWPADPVIARAYIDQLTRDNAISDSLVADLSTALDSSATRIQNGASDKALAAKLNSLAASLEDDGGDAITSKRRTALAETLSGIAVALL
jgi:hypothetical protein